MAAQHTGDSADSPRLGRIGKRSYRVLWLSIVIRTVHLISAAVFLAVSLLDGVAMVPVAYSVMAMCSGVALVLTEWLRHRELYREMCGVITIGKCLLLGGVMHGMLPAAPTILLVFILASFGAHAPKNVRHRLLY